MKRAEETEVYLINLDTGWEEEFAVDQWRERERKRLAEHHG